MCKRCELDEEDLVAVSAAGAVHLVTEAATDDDDGGVEEGGMMMMRSKTW